MARLVKKVRDLYNVSTTPSKSASNNWPSQLSQRKVTKKEQLCMFFTVYVYIGDFISMAVLYVFNASSDIKLIYKYIYTLYWVQV